MKRPTKFAYLLLVALALPLAAAAADLYVIANPAVELQASDIRDVYLGEKLFGGSAKLHPVDNAAAQPAFLAKVMQMSATSYGTAWTKKAFRQGLTQPPSLPSDAAVLEFVRQTAGAVGYVRTRPAGVKVLDKVSY